jgi:hypothetical protein
MDLRQLPSIRLFPRMAGPAARRRQPAIACAGSSLPASSNSSVRANAAWMRVDRPVLLEGRQISSAASIAAVARAATPL